MTSWRERGFAALTLAVPVETRDLIRRTARELKIPQWLLIKHAVEAWTGKRDQRGTPCPSK